MSWAHIFENRLHQFLCCSYVMHASNLIVYSTRVLHANTIEPLLHLFHLMCELQIKPFDLENQVSLITKRT